MNSQSPCLTSPSFLLQLLKAGKCQHTISSSKEPTAPHYRSWVLQVSLRDSTHLLDAASVSSWSQWMCCQSQHGGFFLDFVTYIGLKPHQSCYLTLPPSARVTGTSYHAWIFLHVCIVCVQVGQRSCWGSFSIPVYLIVEVALSLNPELAEAARRAG